MMETRNEPTWSRAYEVLKTLTMGPQEAVHRARHIASGEEVTLKTNDHAAIAHEAYVLSHLEHPHIARSLEHGPGWLALEPTSGVPMRTIHPGRLNTRSLQRRVQPFLGLCHALAYLHGKGWVHTDLSPHNVRIADNGHLTLVGLGHATRFDQAPQLLGRSDSSHPYQSSEQRRGEPLDARADLYALGCMLYEQLTGAPPDPSARSSRPRLAMPRPLERVLMRMISRDRTHRPGHAYVLLRALSESGLSAPHPPIAPRAYLTHQDEDLGPEALSRAELQELLGRALGGLEPPAPLEALLWERAQGHPERTLEQLRALIDQELLMLHTDGTYALRHRVRHDEGGSLSSREPASWA